jgi:hypothetical protein
MSALRQTTEMSNRSLGSRTKSPSKTLGHETFGIGGWERKFAVASDEPNASVAEIDEHSCKRRKSRVFSQNAEIADGDGTGWLTTQSNLVRTSLRPKFPANREIQVICRSAPIIILEICAIAGYSAGLSRESEQGICRGGTGKINSRSGNSSAPSPMRFMSAS